MFVLWKENIKFDILIEFSAPCLVWSEWDEWACVLFWPVVCYISEANESAFWGRTESKIPLFPSIVLLTTGTSTILGRCRKLLSSGCCSDYCDLQKVFCSVSKYPAKLLSGHIEAGEEESLQSFYSIHPALTWLSCKLYGSMNTREECHFEKKGYAQCLLHPPVPWPPPCESLG